MGAVNLGTWRIAIIVALVVVGVAVLANGFDDDGAAVAAPSGSASPTPASDGDGDGQNGSPSPQPTQEPEETPAPNESGVSVKVFNGTSVPGLAALVQDQLVEEGNEAPEEPANAPVVPVTKTAVYFLGGPQAAQNEADATYIADTYIAPVVGRAPRVLELSGDLDAEVGEGITVVVLVGDDYAANLDAAGGEASG